MSVEIKLFLIKFDAVFCSSISHSSYQIIQPYEYVFQQLHSINFLSAIDFLVRHKKILSTNFFPVFTFQEVFEKKSFFRLNRHAAKIWSSIKLKKDVQKVMRIMQMISVLISRLVDINTNTDF